MKTSELKVLVTEAVLEILNKNPQQSVQWRQGQALAVRDKQNGVATRDVRHYSADFQKGYNFTMGRGTWDAVNAKLTGWLGALGYGNSRKF
jgi:hypothetical protein